MDPKDRKIKNLEQQLKELSELFVKNDQELRKKIRDIRITNMASVAATEFTIVNRLGITCDVVMAMLPDEVKPALEKIIALRLAACPDTVETARLLAAKQYEKEGDDY